ncbi:hypothetical protein CBER1_02149 [Cercospora berteroae]|uniref:Uncharacterized protein n=1 Tax=Cercospora berteroae TaxID=357750 RepID=A0A2S6BQD9_9PEZI|nr:hypothetical protein CBER1_02149 [Cercospora berteroae]
MPPPPIPGPAVDPPTLKRKPKTGNFSIFHTIGADYDHRHEPPPELKRGSLGILYDPAEVSDGEEEEEEDDGGVPIDDSPVETEAERKAREMDELAGSFDQGPPDDVLDSLLPSDDEEELESSGPDEDSDHEMDD